MSKRACKGFLPTISIHRYTRSAAIFRVVVQYRVPIPQPEIDEMVSPRTFLGCFAFLSVTFLISACSTRVHVAAFTVPKVTPPSQFSAGAETVDITPPPGYPLGGHGPAGNVGIGYWTRLYGRAFYFRPTGSDPFAMVSVDLFAVPEGLTQKILQIVNDADIPLAPDRFVLAATHTHHSPGNYMTSRVHSDVAAFEGGYDPCLFNWLAERISGAIIRAAQHAQPSVLALYQGEICDLQINRALQPFAENPDYQKVLDARNAACAGRDAEPLPRRMAVNPVLQVLKVNPTHASEWPGGLLVFYAVHPTVLRPRMPLYSGDMVTAAMRYVETHQHDGAKIVAGFFNGAEGDIIPPKVNRDLDEAETLGQKFGSDILDLVDHATPKTEKNPQIYSSRMLVPRTANGFAVRPMAGVPLIGGGEFDRSQYSSEGWWDGVSSDKEVIPGQGNKAPVFDKRAPLPLIGDMPVVRAAVKLALLPPSHFPEHLPVALHVIAGLVSFAAIPVEATTTVGFRIAEDVAKMTSQFPEVTTAFHNPQIIGLANEYYSYTATGEEYKRQHYEGASTLLGRGEANTLKGQLTSLNPVPASTETTQEKKNFTAGKKKHFGPTYFIELRAGKTQTNTLPDLELEDVMPDRLHFQEVSIPRFGWTEHCKEQEEDRCAADWSPELRDVQIIHAENTDSIVESESDLHIITVLRRALMINGRHDRTDRDWVAFWIWPKCISKSSAYRFKVTTAEQPNGICSESFTLEHLQSDKGLLPATLKKESCPGK